MSRRTFACALAATLAAGPAAADRWMVYVGGGIEAIEGDWSERRGRVLFTRLGGTLVSVPYDDVDLAASSFITWQLGGRTGQPPRLEIDAGPGPPDAAPPPCVPARLLRWRGAESAQIELDGKRELVHVACLDAPETQHKFPQLAWFGEAALRSVESAVPGGSEICVGEQSPPQRDGKGHRIVSISLADGRDYVAELIGGGLGLVRAGPCRDAARYRAIEDRAIAARRGLWGPEGAEAAFAAADHQGAASAGRPPPRARPAPGSG